MIGLVDYGMGNRRSVEKALEHVGADVRRTGDHEVLRAADGLVLPGVGAFPRAMESLRERGLDRLLEERGRAGVPLLGICLGMQLLFDSSTELEPTRGLGLIGGEVTRLRAGGRRIPHIGWNGIDLRRPSPLTAGLPDAGAAFYHVHSYAVRPASEEDVVATAEYGESFATVVARGTVMGAQFHPEKSSVLGLRMLANFAALCAQPAAAGERLGSPVRA
jgi:glutamine amidotransferase